MRPPSITTESLLPRDIFRALTTTSPVSPLFKGTSFRTLKSTSSTLRPNAPAFQPRENPQSATQKSCTHPRKINLQSVEGRTSSLGGVYQIDGSRGYANGNSGMGNHMNQIMGNGFYGQQNSEGSIHTMGYGEISTLNQSNAVPIQEYAQFGNANRFARPNVLTGCVEPEIGMEKNRKSEPMHTSNPIPSSSSQRFENFSQSDLSGFSFFSNDMCPPEKRDHYTLNLQSRTPPKDTVLQSSYEPFEENVKEIDNSGRKLSLSSVQTRNTPASIDEATTASIELTQNMHNGQKRDEFKFCGHCKKLATFSNTQSRKTDGKCRNCIYNSMKNGSSKKSPSKSQRV